MQAVLHFCIGPVIGAIIGLITNGIAIRMLFRPLHPVKIGRWTLPFTPGIIPKGKPRIARACGRTIGKYLVNEEAIGKTLLSEETDLKLRDSISQFVKSHRHDESTVRDVLAAVMGEEKSRITIISAKDSLVREIYKRIYQSDVDAVIAEKIVAEAQKVKAYQAMAFLIRPETIYDKSREIIRGFIEENGVSVLSETISRETDAMLDITVAELFARYEGRLSEAEDAIIKTYHEIVRRYLSRAMQALNIAKIVEDQINSFDVLEGEKMILDIVQKELNAIVWFGGLLGLIMGFIMNFF